MKIPIEVFSSMLRVAEKHGINQTKWGNASGMSQPRVAELIQIGKGIQNNRACTFEKCSMLYKGLVILAGEKVRVELYEEAQTKDLNVKIIMQAMMLKEVPFDDLKHIENTLDFVIRKNLKLE